MRRSPVVLAVVIVAAVLAASPAKASALPGPCDVVGIPFVPDPVEKACKTVTGSATHVAGDLATDAAKAVAAPIFRQATDWVAQGAGWLVGRVGALIDTSTTPRLKSRWFAGQYTQMALLATALALPLLFLAVIQAALARNHAVIGRALAAVPVAFVLTGGAVAIVAALLDVTDWACQGISVQAGADSRDFFHDVAHAFATITATSGGAGTAPALFVALLASIFAALAALAVWMELLVRSAGIYVCVLFFPVVLVARIWPKLERWATRLAEALTALILSKFVVVAVLSVAAAGIANSGAGEGFNGVLAAGALLVFAAFAPLVLFRLVQFADPALHARAGTAGTFVRGGQTTSSAAHAARSAMDRQAARGSLGAAGAVDAARGMGARTDLTSLGGSAAGRGSVGGQGMGGSASRVAARNSSHPMGASAADIGGADPAGRGATVHGTDDAGGASDGPRRPDRGSGALGSASEPGHSDIERHERRPLDPGTPDRPRGGGADES